MLEEALKENTAAVRELTAALKAHKPESAQPEGAQQEKAPAPPAPARSRKAAAAAPLPATPPPPTVGVKAVADAVIEVANKKGREKALAILGQFGVSRVSDLKPHQLPEALGLAEKELLEEPVAAPEAESSLV